MNLAEQKLATDLSKWEVKNPVDKDQYYNCDAVIEAYLKGEKDGLKNEQKVLFNQFTQNLEKSKTHTVSLLNIIESNGFTPLAAYIRFLSFDVFQALISIPENDFIKDEFLSVYNKAMDIEEGIKDDIYTLNFSFIPVGTEDFEENVIHDGFIIHVKKS